MTTNILMIDDNPDDLDFYSDLLSQTKQEFQVITAENGEQAMEIFASNIIHCTFIDYNLPEMNGVKILELLSESGKGTVFPLVILTGEPNQTVQAEAARKGALNYFVKDTTNTPEQLEEIIDKTVEWAAALNSQNKAM